MIHIERTAKPAVLVENEVRWQEEYEAEIKIKPGCRPRPSRYRHPKILEALRDMSYNKCFYCEKSLKGESGEIDHHIEVGIDCKGAYAWDNLVLSCDNCNNKKDHNRIPVDEALDPCRDSNEKIRSHLTFVDEIIMPKENSQIGRKTIDKYRLSTERLDYQRMRRLNILSRKFIEIANNMIADGRNELTEYERDELLVFADAGSEFSFMCSNYLRRIAGRLLFIVT